MTNVLHNECKQCHLFVLLVLSCTCASMLLVQSLTNDYNVFSPALTRNEGVCCSVDLKEDCREKTQSDKVQLESQTNPKVGKWLPGKMYKQTPCRHRHFYGCCNSLGE